jgi:hypothetical protein
LKKRVENKTMAAKRYKVTLTQQEREKLTQLVSKGKSNARTITRARILLLADENQEKAIWIDAQIADALGISSRTVERIRQTCVEEGIEVTDMKAGDIFGGWLDEGLSLEHNF